MTPLWQHSLEQFLGACLLAVGVSLLGLRCRTPAWMHVAWILVLFKLVIPPLVRIESGAVDLFATLLAHAASLHADPMRALSARQGASQLLLGVWLTGALVRGWRVMFAVSRLRRLLAGGGAASPVLQREVGLVAERLELPFAGKPPALVLVDEPMSPCVVGCGARARLVFPRALLGELSPEQRQMVLGHELLHVARGDPWLRVFEAVLGVMFWWNPLVWWASTQLRRWEELARDARLLAAYATGRAAYAQALVLTAELVSAGSQPHRMVSALSAHSSLFERLQRVLETRPTTHRRWRQMGTGGVSGIGMALGLVLLFLAGPALATVQPRTVFATDDAGPFQVVFDGPRVRRVVVGGEVLASSRWRQLPSALDVLDVGGVLDFRIHVDSDQSIRWQDRGQQTQP